MTEIWQQDYLEQLTMLPMQQLEQLFGLSGLREWPNADGLNTLKNKLLQEQKLAPDFICQSQLPDSDDYYEQIIHARHAIPTRPDSWHDLFNGLIWLQFPKTKRVLNQLHVEDINRCGLSPRTKRRNKLTHFDECGVIVTYFKDRESDTATNQIIEKLKNHQWQSVFVENRHLWGNQLNAFIFGHANLEMLLRPYIGLTGKWLPVEVDKEFSKKNYLEQLSVIDETLSQDIIQNDIFSKDKPLYPLPLLGIPGVWDANKQASFYQDTQYFRPKPAVRIS